MQQRKADVLPRVGHEALAVLPICRGTIGLFMSARQTRPCLSDSNRGDMRSHFSRTFKDHPGSLLLLLLLRVRARQMAHARREAACCSSKLAR